MDSWGRGLPSRRGVTAIGVVLLVVFATGVAAGVEGEPNVSVFAPENSITPGGTTQIELQLMNSGTVTEGASGLDAVTNQGGEQQVQTARNVTVEAEADGPPFDVETGSTPVGALQDGAVSSVPVTLSVNDDANANTYLLSVTVDYVYTAEINGSERTTAEETITEEVPIVVEETADFEANTDDSSLGVGEDGEIAGEIENTGSETANGATLRLTSEYGTIDVAEREYSLGDIDPGESASFSYDADVSGEASAGERPVDFAIEYEDEYGTPQNATADDQLSVAEDDEEFSVEPVNATLESGDSDVVELNVTNERDEPVSNLDAKLFADSPLDATSDQAYAQELDAGESTVLSFEVSVESGAMEKQYPLEVDFSYENADGESRLSDSYQVPVEVTEPTDDGLLPGRVGIGLLGVVAVGLAVGGRHAIR